MHSKNTTWSFKVDHVHTYAFYKKLFSKEECEEIIKIGKSLTIQEAKVTEKELKNTEIRDSKISWIYPEDKTAWIFQRLTDSIVYLNENYFKFELYGLNEGLQFTNYVAPSGHYDSHVDSQYNMQVRKLSISIQLTDPSEYEGGDLELIHGFKPFIAEKEQGMMYAFPSYTLHKVTPVTKGERNSLVCWVTGPSFK